MKRILATVGLVATLAPFAAMAASGDPQETALMAQAKITLAQAGDLALKEHPGTLAEVGFNNENGRGVYEARVPDASGRSYTVKIDAMTGAVLASGDTALMGESADGAQDGERNDAHAEAGGSDGETADDHDMTGGK